MTILVHVNPVGAVIDFVLILSITFKLW